MAIQMECENGRNENPRWRRASDRERERMNESCRKKTDEHRMGATTDIGTEWIRPA